MIRINKDKKVISIEEKTPLTLQIPTLSSYKRNMIVENEFKEHCLLAVLQVLVKMGLNSSELKSIKELRDVLQIIPDYEELLETIIQELKKAEYLQIVNQKIYIPNPIEEKIVQFSLERQLLEVKNTFGFKQHYYELLFQSIQYFEEVLTGKIRATDVLFPKGDSNLVSAIYKGNYRSNYFNSIVDSIVAETIQHQSNTGKIKILELGGGTGGTTEGVLKKLKPYGDNITYTFTDISHGFLIEAEKRFQQEYPFLETKIFDITKPIAIQNIPIGNYDMVIGANVIHATPNIAETLKFIKPVIKKNGLLIINELSSLEIFTTLTFGLLNDWWNYEDKELRIKGSPLLRFNEWKQVLSEVGFIDCEVYPKQEDIPQQIIVAKSNGIALIDTQKIEKTEQKKTKKTIEKTLNESIELDDLQQKLIEIAGKTIKLSITEFRKDKPFTDYGFDSILGLTLIKNINQELGINLGTTSIFSYPTIQFLAKHILNSFSNVSFAKDKTSANKSVENKEIEEKSLVNNISKQTVKPNKIAIIGMSGQFGKANNLDEFWEILKNGESIIEKVPKERWDIDLHFDENPKAIQKTYSKWGSFLRDIDKFDPEFFKLSGKEAENMDPQQRIFLQHCWKALEDAAIDPSTLEESKCGVYVGATDGDYYKTYWDEVNEASTFWGISGAILAARISYYLNLKGASVAIDTACSSSLVAMDMGCKSLLSRETDVIITGGISMSVTPEFYKLTSMAGMLSPDGQCYTFDERANGFVPGEGAGVLIMKRLDDAIRDGDPIYATIEGILTNQDGSTNGITAPSVLSQQNIQKEVFDKYQINPETITYVETHGTGTKLGDPIELQALNTSFKSYTSKINYCGIGSVKTNIGHTLRAAGAAGIIKVLLAMKNNQLPPSINYKKLNQHIQLKDSPFRIQDKLTAWESESPKRATVSSFGISGTNAFVVLEEYIHKNNVQEVNEPSIIVLSALNEERLKVNIQHLIEFIKKEENLNLQDIAYTLQIGRKAMEYRKSFIVNNKKELTDNLMQFLELHNTSKIKINKVTKATIDQAIRDKQYTTIATYWEQGNTIDWLKLYNTHRPNKIHLPTYNFAKESYWITAKGKPKSLEKKVLHPLVHENTSTIELQKFSSFLTGSEPIISDHIVKHKKVLPGVACFEMAREALQRSGLHGFNNFSDIKWLHPITINDQSQLVETNVYSNSNETIVEITTVENDKTTVCFQAKITENKKDEAEVYRNIETIKERSIKNYTKEQCYQIFEKKGIKYGERLKRIDYARITNEQEALINISPSNNSEFSLPVEILDNALQSCALLWIQNSEKLALPYAIENFHWDDLKDEVKYCYSVHNQKDETFEVELLNAEGKVLSKLSGYKMIPFTGTNQPEKAQMYLYQNTWEDKPIQENGVEEQEVVNEFLILGDFPNVNIKGNLIKIDDIEEINVFSIVFEKVKKAITTRTPIRFIVLYDTKIAHKVQFLSSLLRTASIENPKILWKSIGIGLQENVRIKNIFDTIINELKATETIVKYNHNLKRSVQALTLVSEKLLIDQNHDVKFVEGGVYLITGGMGGIGKILIKHLSEKYNDITLIVNGRSALNEFDQAYLKTFKNLTYYRCDITNKLAVQQLIDEIQSCYGKLNGIIHAAGIVKDNFIQQKKTEGAVEVFAVKTKGIINLHEATQHISLDFIVLFSSIAAVLGNEGQADYAAANQYLNDFATFRNKEVLANKVFGKTISIAWPLWNDGGMQTNAIIQKSLKKKFNLVPLPKKVGMHWLENLLNCNVNSLVLHYGKAALPKFDKAKSIQKQKISEEMNTSNGADLKEAAYEYFIDILVKELHFPKSKFKITDRFEKYGLNSIMMTSLINQLEGMFPDIPKTLFFEYLTIEELITFFVEEYPNELEPLIKNKKMEVQKGEVEMLSEIKEYPRKQSLRRTENITFQKNPEDSKKGKTIAIVGLSGKYPQADSIEDFWENLKIGKDCITEIPKDRWNLNGFYDSEKGKVGKSYTKWGGFINDVDKFDPLFFNITPIEAEKIDPQERLFLQTAWEAIEDAGYTKKTLRKNPYTGETDGKVGVYVGVMYQEYQLYGVEEHLKGNPISTQSSASSVANRVSYVLDLHGPSLSLDTMCSSSSTAIHLACKAIQEGEIHTAIAGGVNLSIHPNKYLMLSDGGFASTNGKCASFGEGGDGYVPGEGVGAIVLKTLDQAEKDGDHIYGLIQGSSLNHGGRTTGYTVPNPRAQAEVISNAIKKSGIKPQAVSYIEAHGTGTSLGDPIEIVGLQKALKIKEDQLCRIGSVKSNIGHCESAAGISGITKVLLQLKHKKLVPSIHSSELNSNIPFNQSGFVVQQELTDWQTTGQEPLTAGISSFGAGGSNVHIIIQEYPVTKTIQTSEKEDSIIVLSAKNKNRLIAYASQLLNHLETTEESLSDIAHTLQVGRESMSERLSIVTNSKELLKKQLNSFVENHLELEEDIFTGNVGKDSVDFLLKGKAGEAYIKEAIREKELISIAQLWVKGIEIDWSLLHPSDRVFKKVSLPTYPFAKERYWIETVDSFVTQQSNFKLHPLVHVNESDFKTQKYTSSFTGAEYFLKDHLVQNEKLIAGVAYLEIAREVAERSIHQKVTQFKEVTWLNPIKVLDQPKKITTQLEVLDSEIKYQIHSNVEGKEHIHGQGIVNTVVLNQPSVYNINRIKSRTDQTISSEECYKTFKELGFDYGKSFQGVQELYFNDTEALAKIELPKDQEMILDPGALDSALQGCLAWLLFKNRTEDRMSLSVPFTVEEINIYKEVTFPIWSYSRVSKESNPKVTTPQCDIDLLNDKGEVVISFKDFIILPYKKVSRNQTSKTNNTLTTELYTQHWEESEAIITNEYTEYDNEVVLVGTKQSLIQNLEETFTGKIHAISEQKEEDYCIKVFELLKERMNHKKTGHFSIVINNQDYNQYGFITGMLKSATKENPKVKTKLIAIESFNEIEIKELLTILQNESANNQFEVRYINKTRQVKKTTVLLNENNISNLSIKKEGVYLITGGAGGIGSMFAKHIAKIEGTQLILTGRKNKNELHDKSIVSLPRTDYYACDITNYEEVDKFIQKIVKIYGKIDGIIHCAGIGLASTITNKKIAEIHEVLSPKITGVKNLDKAVGNTTIDFMMYCSSISSVLGDIGLSDYAAANAYMDNYASYRNQLVEKGERKGKTLTVNWGLWNAGGMQTNTENIEFLLKQWGMSPLLEKEGLTALDKVLQIANEQTIVLHGIKNKLDATLGILSQKEKALSLKASSINTSSEELYAIAYEKVVGIFQKELKLKEEQIQSELPFEEYGIDSMLIVKLSNRLGDIFEGVSVSLLFEYQTINQLVGYFVKEHSEVLQNLKAFEQNITVDNYTNQTELSNVLSNMKNNPYQLFSETKLTPNKEEERNSKDIAIIGLSGIYPEAENVDIFWENLKAGKNSITEIPENRWDINGFYNERKINKGTSYSKWGGFIDDVDKFDPLFFNISPREASMMDPQERLFLQTVWHTIEDAGYTKKKLQNIGKESSIDLGGDVGVFVGVMYEEYQLFGVEERQKGNFIAPTGNASSIANRVSYFLNLHGPSMAIATMCSSSLVAIQMACESIQAGNCEAAIAGGVNLSIHPSKYLMLSDLHLVSEKGKCEAFGEGGDGYVPSEGVGAIMLKPLHKAKEDGDQIYGVIKGGAINHGGKVNGYTVPNPNAQSAVISKAMKRAGVSPDSYSYIEAHGTGTKLGDPIEITGLKKAFVGTVNQSCKIGSVKSNIGHAESAAGISGVTKVILQLKNKQLVPSLHAEKLNTNIDFESTPFQVQQKLEDWIVPNEKPRIAGISSFGAGGTNVHLIIEEYYAEKTQSINNQNPVMIPLSAKDSNRLDQYVQNLIQYIETEKQQININDLAYTLQTGRESMEYRAIFIVNDLNELIVKLKEYTQSPSIAITGKIETRKLITTTKTTDAVREAIKSIDYDAIATLWSQGEVVDWDALYSNRPNIVSLPNYPFAKDYCWFKSKKKQSVSANKIEGYLTSEKNQFTSHFSGKERFIANHKLKGAKVMPGVAFLELAKIVGAQFTNDKITQIKDVFWLSPLQVNTSRSIITNLDESNEGISYSVVDEVNRSHVFNQGKILTTPLELKDNIEIEAIENILQKTIDGDALYSMFDSMGLQYERGFRGIKTLKYSSNQVLAKIQVSKEDTENYWAVQVMDCALQTCIGIHLNNSITGSKPFIPFGVKEVNLYREIPQELWAYVQLKNQDEKTKKERYDVHLLTTSGEPIISFIDFVTLPYMGDTKKNPNQNTYTQKYSYLWKEEAVLKGELPIVETDYEVIIAGKNNVLADHLTEILGIQVTNIQAKDEEEIFNIVLETIKQKLLNKIQLHYIILFEQEDELAYSFLSGILKSVTKENPIVSGKTIVLDKISMETIDQLYEIIKIESTTRDQEVKYVNGKRQVRTLSRYQNPLNTTPISIKSGGTYLITGGAGGLGLIFANYLNQFQDVKLYLLGRSELSTEKKNDISRLNNATYLRCDITNKKQLTNVIDDIVDSEGQINGIIHSAGVGIASQIVKKTSSEIQKVLAPKIMGTRLLDETTQHLPLDFMIYTSSISSILGDIGLADYSAANAYMDSYAKYRNQLVENGKRFGKSITINWGLWEEGGLQINEESKKYLEYYWGMKPMPTKEGINALAQILQESPSQVIVVHEKESKLMPEKEVVKTIDNQFKSTVSIEDSIAYLREIIAKELMIEPKKIGLNTLFETYGMDSIRIVKLTNRLNEEFGEVPSTLFFESPTLEELANYLLENYTEKLSKVFSISKKSTEEKNIAKEISLNNPSPIREKEKVVNHKIMNEIHQVKNNEERTSIASLKEKSIAYLINILKEELSINLDGIGLNTPFETYGMGSIQIVKLTNRLIHEFGEVPNTLFFEYPTLAELADYFLENHKDKLIELFPELKTEQSNDTEDFNVLNEKTSISKKENQGNQEEGIAIIGISGKFPKSNTLEEFWENLKVGKDCITEVPRDRWDIEKYFDKEVGKIGKTHSRWGGYIEDVDKFDPLFFNISPKEAEITDPQERLFLQAAWEVVEDAGYIPDDLDNVGVYVGVMHGDYAMLGSDSLNSSRFTLSNAIHSSIANRVSYVMNFDGPCMSIDTMCSSSTTAIHLACESIRNGESSFAIAGGANLNLHPYKYISLSNSGFISAQGKCASFGEGADGYVPSEGIGAILLKPLSKAKEDGDHIYGVIRSTAINHGGRANGYYVPNPKSQAKVIKKALKKANIAPKSIQYIEAHGTGTSLGDPIEISGLTRALQEETGNEFIVGSVKSNMGHCEAAAGMSGVMKILLQFKNKQIAPSIHSDVLNKRISFDKIPFKIQRKLSSWDTKNGEKRMAGLSSFGAGGSNAHIIFEEYQDENKKIINEGTPVLIVLSGKNSERLKYKAKELITFLDNNQDTSLIDLAYTLQVGRVAMESRICVKVTSIQQLKEELKSYIDDEFLGYQKNLRSYELGNKSIGSDDLYNEALEGENLVELAKLWIKGRPIEWKKLYDSTSLPKRISLPTYPFLKNRYWIPEPKQKPINEKQEKKSIHPLFQN